MAQIGALGDIIFTVSSKKVLTFSGMQVSGSASYAEHQLHLRKSLVEYTGESPDKASFSIQLRKNMGADVDGELGKMKNHKKAGTALVLILGEKQIGEYRWVVNDYKIDMSLFDAAGNLTEADVSLSLLEYLKE